MAGQAASNAPLRAADVAEYLRERGILAADGTGEVQVLAGGVSADVFAADSSAGRVVIKQALPRLKVAARWEADPGRVIVEAEALRLAAAVAPDSVPQVVDLDPVRHVLLLEHAPATFRNWKAELLAGRIEPGIAARLGDRLARWHTVTAGRPELTARFGGKTGFVALRIEPFYRAVARRHPHLRERLSGLADRLLSADRCLVHGDFSPKNVLTDGAQVWVLDWEVAHLGDPVFDLAFMTSHLVAKALHRPESGREYRACAAAFLAAYRDAAAAELAAVDLPYLSAHAAALLLARVDGTSPVDYLDEAARHRARDLAVNVLTLASAPADIWELL
jgi:aminoglycoside phosphotransferase (APT) family kinase protein